MDASSNLMSTVLWFETVIEINISILFSSSTQCHGQSCRTTGSAENMPSLWKCNFEQKPYICMKHSSNKLYNTTKKPTNIKRLDGLTIGLYIVHNNNEQAKYYPGQSFKLFTLEKQVQS